MLTLVQQRGQETLIWFMGPKSVSKYNQFLNYIAHTGAVHLVASCHTSITQVILKIGFAKIININYNMVGVVVAMVISTMHEKSCIDSHNARKFENSSKIQSFTHLAITVMKLRKYHNHEFFKLS